MQILAFLAVALLSLIALSACAPAEEDGDTVADTAIKGLTGQGTLSSDKPTKDGFGSDYQ